MSGYLRNLYRGKYVYTEADCEWADRNEDAIADRLLARWAAKYGTPARVVTGHDPSVPNEVERDWNPEATV